ncbi:MAG TPA: PRC-barrel domain-containing protein [Actinomycetota bacterium]|nr:PRC-barrel domain-containing protein [Actinomycetota bacterium]
MTTRYPIYRASQRAVLLEPKLRGCPLFDGQRRRIGHVVDVLYEERPIEETGILKSGIIPLLIEVSSHRWFWSRKALLPLDSIAVQSDGVHVNGSHFDVFGPSNFAPAPDRPRAFQRV